MDDIFLGELALWNTTQPPALSKPVIKKYLDPVCILSCMSDENLTFRGSILGSCKNIKFCAYSKLSEC